MSINTRYGNQKLNIGLKPTRDTGVGALPILLNFVKGMVGPGCLYVPLAFKQAGLYTALVLILVFGFLNNWCMLKIVHCSQHFSKTNGDIPLDYGDVAHQACANSFLVLRKYKKWQSKNLLVSFCFMAQHLREVTQEITGVDAPEKTWMLMLLLPVMLINLARTLRIIAVFSAIGYVLMLGSLVFIYQYLIRTPHPNINNLPAITDFDGVMTACGLILYSFEGQAMVLPLENRLKRPQRMVGPFGVLSIGMTIVTLVYSITGIIGYATYGNHIKGSISLSLPPTIMFTIVKLALTLVVFFGFVLQQYVIVDVLWPEIRKRLLHKSVSECKCCYLEMVFRVVLVFLAMSIAFIVPNLEQIISLVGVTSGTFLAFIFPAFIDTMTFLPLLLKEGQKAKAGQINWRAYSKLIENAGLVLIGLFGLTAGLQANITSMLQTASN
uniref:Amino acid transporter transmembrane domain-containing protein n=1 Tax=Ditylenchus dipsaci TaxID=166011 RepID=A0A915DNL9_9BILA